MPLPYVGTSIVQLGDLVLAAEILKINPDTPDMLWFPMWPTALSKGRWLVCPRTLFTGWRLIRSTCGPWMIYDVKTRNRHKPLSLLIESVEQAEYLARPLPDVFYEITRKYWPGR